MRCLAVLCSGLLAAGISLAAPVDCVPGSLQSYLELSVEGCSIDDKVVLGFTSLELLTGGTAISPDLILVTPLPVSSNPGFSFDFDENATEGELLQSRFAFTVLVNPGGKPIARVRAALADSAVAPDGTVTAVTDLCLGTEPVAGLCDSESETLILFDIGVEASLQESRGFAPLRQVGVLNDIVLDGGTGGSASLSSLTIRFQEVPEPATFVPVIAGLLALTLLRRRR